MIIRFSGAVMRHVGYRREIEVNARTLREALALVVTEHPALQPILYDARGHVRGIHRLFMGGEQLAATDLDREVGPDARIDVVTSIAGG